MHGVVVKGISAAHVIKLSVIYVLPATLFATFINYHNVTNTLSVVSNAIDEVLKMNKTWF